jgi:two-component system OmpR family sensor kinase
MFTSLRFRLWLTYVLVVGVVLVVVWLIIGIYLVRNPVQDRRELQRLRLISNMIVQRDRQFNLDLSAPSVRLEQAVQRADKLFGARIAVFDASGNLVVDSRSTTAAPLPVSTTFSNRRLGSLFVFRDSDNVQWLYIYTPAETSQSLLVAAPRQRARLWQILHDETLVIFARGGAFGLLLAALLAILIANWIASPLQRLEQATRQVSSDTYKTLPLEGPHEVRVVTRSFNEMVDSLQASQRSQNDLVANISHDLKTPLTSIQGFAQAIVDGTANDPIKACQSAQIIYDEAGRMNRMVSSLLDLARLQAGTLDFEHKPVNMSDLLRRLVEKFSPQARQAQVELRYANDLAQGDVPEITADEDRLSQVFSNLIDNGLKFTPQGGVVTVTSRKVADQLEVDVADTGPGIPAGELGRIFERFYQTDKSRPGGGQRGLGLGLAIAKEIVRAHDGTIFARNLVRTDQAGNQPSVEGSVFVVRLPLKSPDGEKPDHMKKDSSRLPA